VTVLWAQALVSQPVLRSQAATAAPLRRHSLDAGQGFSDLSSLPPQHMFMEPSFVSSRPLITTPAEGHFYTQYYKFKYTFVSLMS